MICILLSFKCSMLLLYHIFSDPETSYQMRSPKEVTKEEYFAFYKKTYDERLDPMAYSHFNTEVCFSQMETSEIIQFASK